MVGPPVNALYRRGMNFLSRNDYEKWVTHYIVNPLWAIVASCTTHYHRRVTKKK
jgi:hypothetical protein